MTISKTTLASEKDRVTRETMRFSILLLVALGCLAATAYSRSIDETENHRLRSYEELEVRMTSRMKQNS